MLILSTSAVGPFCKERVLNVPLYCHCFRPWIDGTSAARIFGKDLKEFNLYQCCQCQNWFHFSCLKERGIIPKRNSDFKCHQCAIPLFNGIMKSTRILVLLTILCLHFCFTAKNTPLFFLQLLVTLSLKMHLKLH